MTRHGELNGETIGVADEQYDCCTRLRIIARQMADRGMGVCNAASSSMEQKARSLPYR